MATMNPKIDDDDDEESASKEVVVANEDLLIQILLFLPPKSLLRFKSVSKAWLSLISSKRVRLLKSKRFRKDVSGVFASRRSGYEEFEFFPMEGGYNSPFEILDYVADEKDGLKVTQSCNGLLLCHNPRLGGGGAASRMYYIVNPTTKEYKSFSKNDMGSEPFQVNLAFDPRKSIHFKLVCIYRSYTEDYAIRNHMRIYSSETGLLTQSDEIFEQVMYDGVYWNDAINWIDEMNDGMYFNINEGRFGIIPMPPLPHVEGWDEQIMGRWIRYYGESNDHLYLVCTETTPTTQLHVYEMDREYSGWSLRFCVDLQPVFSLYPEVINHLHSNHLHPNLHRCTFEILAIVDKDDDEGSLLVLTIPGKAIKFNLKDKSFSKICDYAPLNGLNPSVSFSRESFQFIESLHPL